LGLAGAIGSRPSVLVAAATEAIARPLPLLPAAAAVVLVVVADAPAAVVGAAAA
jgi:hypothetical protein